MNNVDSQGKKICLITPNHIATNPRLVKEAAALSQAGYQVHLVFTQHVKEVVEEDFKILAQYPCWTFQTLDWTGARPRSRFARLWASLLHKIHSKLATTFFYSTKVFLNRNYSFQLKAAKESEADLFIAHNAGALAVAADAAIHLHKPYSFDAEDFHRGESLSPDAINAVCRVEDRYLPSASYVSAASPLIGEAYQRLYGISPIVINNVFPIPVAPALIQNEKPVPMRLYWFSQSVGWNRGLQDVFGALKLVENLSIECHIYGKVYLHFREEYKGLLAKLDFTTPPSIFFHGTVSPNELLSVAAQYDIGLALEPGFCLNNRIALSNKIFTYLLGGNAIIFSETEAQARFYQEHPDVGFLYAPKDVKTLASIITNYYNNRELLREHRNNSKRLFESQFNWNLTQAAFLSEVERCLQGKVQHRYETSSPGDRQPVKVNQRSENFY